MKIQIKKQSVPKMHLILGALLCILIWANAGQETKMGQQVPKEVQEIIDNYFKDTTCWYRFENNKELYHVDASIKLSDLEAGAPIHRYNIASIDSLEKTDENSPIKAFAVPTSLWIVPVRAHGKYLYAFEISKNRGFWHIQGGSGWDNEFWQKIKAFWPESAGYYPVVIYFPNYAFLHFPSKDDYNLLYLKSGYVNDSLEMLMPRTYDSLSDSRVILRYLKKQIPKIREAGRIYREEGDK